MANDLSGLDPRSFFALSAGRENAIGMAAAKPLAGEWPANRLAALLHPERQYLKVERILDHGNGTKSFILTPNAEKGTNGCAFFSAGQYLTVFLEIEGRPTNRAYSISSSPDDALAGFYRLTVKAVDGGLCSRYILDHWQVGTAVEVSDPMGNFTYEPLRDAEHIVGIAGGSGITPFLSLAKAIAEGREDCTLTLLYGSRTRDAILCGDELDALCAKCDRIRVVHVISDETVAGCESGLITARLIQRYAPAAPFSIFVCGSKGMYRHVEAEIARLHIEKKYVRYELFGEPHGNPEGSGSLPATVTLTVWQSGERREVVAMTDDTVLQALEKGGIAAPARCRSGECGYCHTALLSGSVYIPRELDHRRLADEKFGRIHPCCTFPLSDLELVLPKAK